MEEEEPIARVAGRVILLLDKLLTQRIWYALYSQFQVDHRRKVLCYDRGSVEEVEITDGVGMNGATMRTCEGWQICVLPWCYHLSFFVIPCALH